MSIIFGTACLYCACFGFFHANPKRTAFDKIKSSEKMRQFVFWGAWILAIIALYVLTQALGWERGIPVWLGVFTLVGVASLLIASLFKQHHKSSGIVAVGIALFSGLTAAIGGMI